MKDCPVCGGTGELSDDEYDSILELLEDEIPENRSSKGAGSSAIRS